MYSIGGHAGLKGITFQSNTARVKATENGKGEHKAVFSQRTRGISAFLRKVPLARAFPAFGRFGTIIFAVLAIACIAELISPGVLDFEIVFPDAILYGLLVVAAAFLLHGRAAIRRILQYHGAEHMALNTYKSGQALSTENISRADRATPNCGSILTLIFFIIAIPLLFVPYGEYFIILALAISFELSVLARKAKALRWLLRFGMWAQRRIFTRPPDAGQIEVARRGLTTLIEIMDNENKR